MMQANRSKHKPVCRTIIKTDAATNAKVRFFRRVILSWYSKNGRHFPWRTGECDAYQIVIGEILLQRTRADTVAKFFPVFLGKYPSWQSLAWTAEDELKEFLRPLGLWQRRAIALKSLAKAILKRGGNLPATRDKLESLPSVGQYIANAVLTMCHNKREPLLDVNMARLLERFFGPRKLADIRYDPYLQELSRVVLSQGRAKDLNWAVLDFAALVCTARNPAHNSCPLASRCCFLSQA
jgi:A/G-specific adenine glycosylase